MMTVTATKKFSEYNQTELYSGIDIDEATQSLIYDWYQFRTVCDDEKFPVFFRRKLERCLHQYLQLCRLENSTFDPLVASYHERLTEYSGLKSETHSDSKTDTGSKNSTTTKNLTDQTIVDRDSSNSSSSASHIADETTTKGAEKAAPQSVSYAGATAGSLPALDWSYMSGQQQQESDGTSDSTVNASGTTSEDSTTTTTHTGTDGIVETTGSTSTGSSSISGSDSNSTREITTGRDGLTPQEAFLKARQWIVISDAFDWLKDELKDCFLGIVEV